MKFGPLQISAAIAISLITASIGCRNAESDSSGSKQVANIVAFGDSITRGYGVPPGEGWVDLLCATMERGASGDVVHIFNAGGNGNTSTEGLRRITSDVTLHLPGLVLVEFGGNDAVHDARYVSVDEFEHNLLAIVREVRQRGGSVALLTFPPVIDKWHVTHSDVFYSRRGGIDHYIETYRQRTRDVARREGLALFDLDHFLRKLMEDHGPAAYIASDGVHLTPLANKLVAEAVFHFLTVSGYVHLSTSYD